MQFTVYTDLVSADRLLRSGGSRAQRYVNTKLQTLISISVGKMKKMTFSVSNEHNILRISDLFGLTDARTAIERPF